MTINASYIDDLEAKLRKGQYAPVREALIKLSRKEIPDRLVLRISQIARRVDNAKKGAMLLRDRVIDLKAGHRAEPLEQAEYAACLLKLGAVLEARRLLAAIPPEQAPEALKYLAFTYVHQWNYAAVIPLLKRYVALPQLPDYARIVGSVNLGAALIENENYQEAMHVLEPLSGQLTSAGHRLTLGNVYELLAQVHMYTANYSRAAEYIELSKGALINSHPRYQLALEKCHAISCILQNPKAAEPLQRVREKAIALNEWEMVRECDFQESIALGNQTMFLNLYFGTPFPAFRSKMLRKSERRFAIPANYIWGGSKPKQFDLKWAYDENQKSVVKKGQALHRCFKALALDFYVPATVTQVFTHVFASERFHPENSAHRVYELIRRLRENLNEAQIECPIVSVDHGYKVDISAANCSLVVYADHPHDGLLEEIKSLFQWKSFRLRDLATRIGIPHTTVYREIKRLVANGDLEVIGHGKETSYVVSKQSLTSIKAS